MMDDRTPDEKELLEGLEAVRKENESLKKELQATRKELSEEKRRRSDIATLRNIIYTLIVVTAAAVLVAMLVMPVLRIYGSSMNPTLEEGDIVISVKGTDFKTGDIVCFYYGSKVLVKRYIAGAGQWVDLDEEGNVYVDGELLDEPYITEKAYGDSVDIEFPYQVPDGRIFVLGDNRDTSVDSRSSSVGCISDEDIIGKIIFRIWPITGIGILK